MRKNFTISICAFLVFIFTTISSCRNCIDDQINQVSSNNGIKNPNFITIWRVGDYTGFFTEKRIIIPTHKSYGYKYDLKWSKVDDPKINGESLNKMGNAVINFPSAGDYRVEISGDFPAIYFNEMIDKDDAGNKYKDKIISIENWGDIEWRTMENAFAGCSKLNVSAQDAPNLSKVKNMSYMFYGVERLTASLDHWDVSNVTDMNNMFAGATYFNQPLNKWKVDNVTNMSFMFFGNKAFNQPLNRWNVSNVTNMKGMFYGSAFNQNIHNWNVSNVTNMSKMFRGSSFNQPIDNWNVGNVTDMSEMFTENTVFNQSLNNWNVGNVMYMNHMFSSASLFNQSLNNWNINNKVILNYMFLGAKSFDKQNIKAWNINVINKERREGIFE